MVGVQGVLGSLVGDESEEGGRVFVEDKGSRDLDFVFKGVI